MHPKLNDRNFVKKMDLTTLQLFVVVCELGSIGKAAEREFIAASALSKRLSDLEIALGTVLLYRHSRGVDATPAGLSLLHHARAVLFGLEKLQGELSEFAHGVRGHVRMHANMSAIVQFLPEDLGVFTRRHEHIKIDLEEHVSVDVVRAVTEGAADVGICNTSVGVGRLQALRYKSDRLMLVCPKKHPLVQYPRTNNAIDFESTLDFDQVGLHSNSSIHLAVRRATAAAGRNIALRVQVTGLDAMCRMIHNGLGVGLVPHRAFELLQYSGDLEAIALSNPWAVRQIDLVARDFAALPITARLLVDHLKLA